MTNVRRTSQEYSVADAMQMFIPLGPTVDATIIEGIKLLKHFDCCETADGGNTGKVGRRHTGSNSASSTKDLAGAGHKSSNGDQNRPEGIKSRSHKQNDTCKSHPGKNRHASGEGIFRKNKETYKDGVKSSRKGSMYNSNLRDLRGAMSSDSFASNGAYRGSTPSESGSALSIFREPYLSSLGRLSSRTSVKSSTSNMQQKYASSPKAKFTHRETLPQNVSKRNSLEKYRQDTLLKVKNDARREFARKNCLSKLPDDNPKQGKIVHEGKLENSETTKIVHSKSQEKVDDTNESSPGKIGHEPTKNKRKLDKEQQDRGCPLHFEEDGTSVLDLPKDSTIFKTVKTHRERKKVKVLWAYTKVTFFDDDTRTYEMMDMTDQPPRNMPTLVEGIFVTAPPKIRTIK